MKRKKVKEPSLNELRDILGELLDKDLEASINSTFMSDNEVELNGKKIDAILSQIERSKENDNTND